jgi:hypothetical protein
LRAFEGVPAFAVVEVVAPPFEVVDDPEPPWNIECKQQGVI